MRDYNLWTEEEEKFVLEHYADMPREELEQALGRKYTSIKSKAFELGVRKYTRFTKEEEAYIEEKFGILTAEGIAKRLGRDTKAVWQKVYHMGLGRFDDNADGYTLSEIARMLGKQRGVVRYWTQHFGLKGRMKGASLIISDKALTKWMRENPERWDATKVTTKWMWQGEEWFEEKRKADFQKMITKRWGEWYPDAK